MFFSTTTTAPQYFSIHFFIFLFLSELKKFLTMVKIARVLRLVATEVAPPRFVHVVKRPTPKVLATINEEEACP